MNVLVSTGTGTAADYTVTASVTYDSADFSAASFQVAAYSLQDGNAADSSDGLIYAYYVPSGGYAANGNLLAHSDSVMGDWAYSYDSLNRLSSGAAVVGPYAGQYGCWGYDSFGNRQLQSLQTSACPSSWTPSVRFNASNQIALAPGSANGFVYDGAGDVIADGLNQYAYDAEGRLCAVKNSNNSFMQYVYDAEGRRVAKGSQGSLLCPVPTSANGFTLKSQFLLSASGAAVSELDGSGNWQHSNAPAGASMATYSSTTTGVWFHLSDPLGSRRILADATGKVQQTCQNLPFGDGETCTATPTEQLFTGKERDAESGNDYFGARYYASSMGRWTSPDPTGLFYADPNNPQSLNLYSYVRNNPLLFVDPDGDFCYQVSGDGNTVTVDNVAQSASDCSSGATWINGTATSYSYGSDGVIQIGYSDSSSSTSGSLSFASPDVSMDSSGNIQNPWLLPLSSNEQSNPGSIGVGVEGLNKYQSRLFGTHWCGPGGGGPVTSPNDAACRAHDKAYAAAGASAAMNLGGATPTPAQAQAMKAANQAMYDAVHKNPAEFSTPFLELWITGGVGHIYPGTAAQPDFNPQPVSQPTLQYPLPAVP